MLDLGGNIKKAFLIVRSDAVNNGWNVISDMLGRIVSSLKILLLIFVLASCSPSKHREWLSEFVEYDKKIEFTFGGKVENRLLIANEYVLDGSYSAEFVLQERSNQSVFYLRERKTVMGSIVTFAGSGKFDYSIVPVNYLWYDPKFINDGGEFKSIDRRQIFNSDKSSVIEIELWHHADCQEVCNKEGVLDRVAFEGWRHSLGYNKDVTELGNSRIRGGYSSDLQKRVRFYLSKSENLNEFRSNITSLISENNIFDGKKIQSDWSRVEPKSLSVANKPVWVDVEFERLYSGFRVLVTSDDQRYWVGARRNVPRFLLADAPESVRELAVDRTLRLTFAADDGVEASLEVPYVDLSPVRAELDRLANLGFGYVRITANQKDVDIYLDNKKIGSITEKPFVAKIPEGRHVITAKRDLYGSESVRVSVEKDDAIAYHFDLQPSGNLSEQIGKGKIVQSIGELVVLTSRNDLAVIVEGTRRIPPFKLSEIASGRYKLRVVMPNGNKTVEAIVEPDKSTVINLDELL